MLFLLRVWRIVEPSIPLQIRQPIWWTAGSKKHWCNGVLTSPILPGYFKRIPPLYLLSKSRSAHSTVIVQRTLIPPPPFHVHDGMQQHPLCPACCLASFHVLQNFLNDLSTSSTPLALWDLWEIPTKQSQSGYMQKNALLPTSMSLFNDALVSGRGTKVRWTHIGGIRPRGSGFPE